MRDCRASQAVILHYSYNHIIGIRPVGLALYGRLNRKSVGSSEAVPLKSAPLTSGIGNNQYSNDYGRFTISFKIPYAALQNSFAIQTPAMAAAARVPLRRLAHSGGGRTAI
eukprot:5433657-Pleurochrysis_carterae.AAC.1